LQALREIDKLFLSSYKYNPMSVNKLLQKY